MLRNFLAGVVLLGTSQVALAVPTYYFDGQITYDSGSGALDITGALTGYDDLSVVPVTVGSSVVFHATFDSSSYSNPITEGTFLGTGGTDFSITDGSPALMLEGGINSLVITGADGSDLGVLQGEVSPDAGATLGDFSDPSSVFSLLLNLDTVFSSTMFASDFSGQVDGSLRPIPNNPQEVPLPAAIWLFGSGLLGLFGVARRRDQ